MILEQGGTTLLCDNKACKVYGIGTLRLKMFDDREILLHRVRYVLDLRRNILFIIMFDDLYYCTRVENGVLRILHGEVNIIKRSNICGLYIFKGFNVIVHLSFSSEDFHDKKKLWDLKSRHVGCLDVVFHITLMSFA